MAKSAPKGQTLLEYILLVLMISVTVAVILRNTNQTILQFWTGLANTVAKPCPTCQAPQRPPQVGEIRP
jgi:Flp pilus assembly pilin Flp